MIPDLDDRGYLPHGVHPASLDEVIARFGHGSEARESQAQSLVWLSDLCRRAGITRLVINGSFVTDEPEPNDVDCLLLQGPAFRAHSAAAAELAEGLPFIEMRVVQQEEFDFYSRFYFATDRDMIPKGVVEVLL